VAEHLETFLAEAREKHERALPQYVEREEFRLHVGPIDGCARAALVVPNTLASTPLSAEELGVLVGATMHW
jgi:hypothetical protein